MEFTSKIYQFWLQNNFTFIIISSTNHKNPQNITTYNYYDIKPWNKCGGIICYYKQSLANQIILTNNKYFIKIDLPKLKILILTAYIPSQSNNNEELYDQILLILDILLTYNDLDYRIILIGDLNLRHPSNKRKFPNRKEKLLYNTINIHKIQVPSIIHCPHSHCNFSNVTCKNTNGNYSFIDIILCMGFFKLPNQIIHHHNFNFNSDHCPISIRIKCKPMISPDYYIRSYIIKPNEEYIVIAKYIFHELEYDITEAILNIINENNEDTTCKKIWDFIYHYLIKIGIITGALEVIPTSNPKLPAPHSFPNLQNIRNQIYQLKSQLLNISNNITKIKINKQIEQLKIKLISESFKIKIKCIYEKLAETEDNINHKHIKDFWSFFNSKSDNGLLILRPEMLLYDKDEYSKLLKNGNLNNKEININIKHQGNIASSYHGKLLNKNHKNYYTRIKHFKKYKTHNNFDNGINVKTLLDAIKTRPYSSPGLDGIWNRYFLPVVRACPAPFVTFINYLYISPTIHINIILQRLVLLKKKPNIEHIYDTRGICIGGCILMLIDAVICHIASKFMEFILRHGLCGGRDERDINVNIYTIRQNIIFAIIKKQLYMASLTDTKKCFDNFVIPLLIESIIEHFGYGNFSRLFISFISNRHIVIQWGGIASFIIRCYGGISQGVATSPLLTNMYNNNILIKSPNINLKTLNINFFSYIDDIILHANHSNILINNHNQLKKYNNNNDIYFNSTKHQVMVFNTLNRYNYKIPQKYNNKNVKQIYDYHINKLKESFPDAKVNPKSVRYLGYFFNHNSPNGNHMCQIVQQRMIAKIKFLMKKGLFNIVPCPETIRIIYLGLIRSCITCFIPSMNINQQNRIKINSIQNICIKNALMQPKSFSNIIANLIIGIEPFQIHSFKIQARWAFKALCSRKNSLMMPKTDICDEYKMLCERYDMDNQSIKGVWSLFITSNVFNGYKWLTSEFNIKNYRSLLNKLYKDACNGYLTLTQYDNFVLNIQYLIRQNMLQYIRNKSFPGKYLIQKIYYNKWQKYKQFIRQYPNIGEWYNEYLPNRNFDKRGIYFKNIKPPLFIYIIEYILPKNWMDDFSCGKIYRIFMSIFCGLPAWKWCSDLIYVAQDICPLCKAKYYHPSLHILYICSQLNNIRLVLGIISIKINKCIAIKYNIFSHRYSLTNNEIIPLYTSQQLWQLSKYLLKYYKYFSYNSYNKSQSHKKIVNNYTSILQLSNEIDRNIKESECNMDEQLNADEMLLFNG